MKKDIHLMQKVLMLVIGILSIMLMAVLIVKGYQLHQENIQKEQWEVRHVEVQAEVDDVRMKIQELSEDSEALQIFLEESLKANEDGLGIENGKNEIERIAEPETEEKTDKQEPVNEDLENPADAVQETESPIGADWEGLVQSGDAILIEEPEPIVPQVPEETVSSNQTDAKEEEETVSGNGTAEEQPEEEEETVSGNGTAEGQPEEEEETVSGNGTAEEQPEEEEETVSGNGTAEEQPEGEEETVSGNGTEGQPEEEEETVSGNGTEGQPEEEEETVSGNGTEEQPEEEETVSGNLAETEPYGTISGNAVVDGKVIPFRYDEENLTLEARRNIRSSYAETQQVNEEDKQIIGGSTYDFSGMTIACLGDSLTQGSNLDDMENYEQYSYPSVLKNILHAKEVYNLGRGGSSYGRYWDQAFVDRYKEIPQDVDIILVMGGTNDGFAASEKEMGSFSEKKPKTFYGDVDELMRGLKENYPEAKIIFATPLPNVLHDYLRNQRNYLLPQSMFAKAIKELAGQYGIDVIDLYNSNLLDTHDAQVISAYMPDGVHGNPDGYQVLAEHMASQIIRIMEKDAAAAAATVSGNSVENEGIIIDESVSGNGTEPPYMQDGKWIEEEIMSEEERAEEAEKAKEMSKKAAEEAMLVEPPAQNADNAEDGVQEDEIQGSGQEEAKEPETDYEYGGEAIIIQ